MQVKHILAQFAPPFFNGIEPRSRGWQPGHFQSWQILQGLWGLVMLVDGPMIPHDRDALGLRVSDSELFEKGFDPAFVPPWNGLESPLSCPGIERPDHPPLLASIPRSKNHSNVYRNLHNLLGSTSFAVSFDRVSKVVFSA